MILSYREGYKICRTFEIYQYNIISTNVIFKTICYVFEPDKYYKILTKDIKLLSLISCRSKNEQYD